MFAPDQVALATTTSLTQAAPRERRPSLGMVVPNWGERFVDVSRRHGTSNQIVWDDDDSVIDSSVERARQRFQESIRSKPVSPKNLESGAIEFGILLIRNHFLNPIFTDLERLGGSGANISLSAGSPLLEHLRIATRDLRGDSYVKILSAFLMSLTFEDRWKHTSPRKYLDVFRLLQEASKVASPSAAQVSSFISRMNALGFESTPFIFEDAESVQEQTS